MVKTEKKGMINGQKMVVPSKGKNMTINVPKIIETIMAGATPNPVR